MLVPCRAQDKGDMRQDALIEKQRNELQNALRRERQKELLMTDAAVEKFLVGCPGSCRQNGGSHCKTVGSLLIAHLRASPHRILR